MVQCALLNHELRPRIKVRSDMISDGGFRIQVAAAIRNCRFLCLCLVLSLAGAASARYSYPASTRIASRGTVPPSSYGSGLITMPGPVDNASNAVVTGNVSGGKAFRGNIPYSSTTSFGGRWARRRSIRS